jgi:hypothetical protein
VSISLSSLYGTRSPAVDFLRFTPVPPDYVDVLASRLASFTGGNLLPDGDLDLDGAGNLLEYICGTNAALESERTGGPQFLAGDDGFVLQCEVHATVPADAISLQRSDDLQSWTGETAATLTRLPTPIPGIENRRWTIPMTVPGRFFRISRP